MRRPLDLHADVAFSHDGDCVRLVGSGRRARLEIPTVRAALALRRAGAAGLFSHPTVAALYGMSEVTFDLWLGPECIGGVAPDGRSSFLGRLLGLRGVTLDPFAVVRAMFRLASG